MINKRSSLLPAVLPSKAEAIRPLETKSQDEAMPLVAKLQTTASYF
uniref:Uncharacterized protein n=1 Tax=Anguilla anguilla TaxID=7936 RepID=A0A0E9S333_ANGAN